MDVAAKKRRLDRELDLGDGNEPLEEDADKRNAMLLASQNRALATNLFVYRRKIATLEQAVSLKSGRLASLEAFVYALCGQLEQFESTLRSLTAEKRPDCAELVDIGDASQWTDLPYPQNVFARFLHAQPNPEATVDDTRLRARLRGVQHATAATLAACAPSDAAAITPLIEHSQTLRRAHHAEELLAHQTETLRDSENKVHTLEEQLRQLERLIERLKYDHPDLDIEAHEKMIAPHGIDIASGVGKVSTTPAGAHLASQPTTTPATCPDINMSVTPAASPTADAGRPAALQTSAQESELAEELEMAKEQLEVYSLLIEELRSERSSLEDERSQLMQQLNDIMATKITEETVLASTKYIQKCQELDALRVSVENLQESLDKANQSLTVTQQKCQLLEAKNADLVKTCILSDDKFNALMREQVTSFNEKVAALAAARDRAMEEAAKQSAAAQAATSAQQQAAEYAALVKRLHEYQDRLRDDWVAVVSRSSAVSSMLAEIRAGGVDVPSVDALATAAFEEEKAQLVSMVASISSEYETALSDLSSRQAALLAKDTEIVRLTAEAHRVSAERAIWESARHALDTQLAVQKELTASLQSASQSQHKFIDQLKEQLGARDQKLASLTAEVQTLKSRADKAAEVPRDLRAQVDELSRQKVDAAARIAAITQELAAAKQQASSLREQLAESNKRVQQRDEKISKLKERAANRADSDSPGLPPYDLPKIARSMSTADIEMQKQNNGLIALRLLTCSCCNVRQKNSVITKCGHLFCKQCIDNTIRSRSRKCPACANGFTADDVKPVYLS